jgi:hypothetical protein
LAEYNPKLQEHSAATRVAYAKFKTKMLISHANEDDASGSDTGSPTDSLNRKVKQQKSKHLGPGRSTSATKKENPPKSISSQSDETPILKPINTGLSKQTKMSPDSAKIPKSTGQVEESIQSADEDKVHAEVIQPKAPKRKQIESKVETPSKLEETLVPSTLFVPEETGFTVVQIESTRQAGTEEMEKAEKASPPSSSSSSRRPSMTPSTIVSPTGKSAVTGQTRTGWI